MSLEANKALVRSYFEDAARDPQVCEQIFAPVIHWHALNHTRTPDFDSTPADEQSTYAWLKKTWGDWTITLDELIAEGDRVMARWTFHGTHQGEYQGLPATGRTVVYAGFNIFRIQDSRIAEIWDLFDRLWLWQQLGALPTVEEFVARARAAGAADQFDAE
jgi:hypothetical protein